ncbi:MAG: hypothetical protein M3336_08540, partial [Chloroflexota bacterium]|nr:hypothetical protein [Chloroflexota bacterium]
MQRFRRACFVLLGAALVAGAVLAPAAAAQAAGWQPGPGAILSNTYDGYIDAPQAGATVAANGTIVNGWFVDRSAEGWAGADDIQIWLGAMDGGGRMLARANIAQDRPDVAAALENPYWTASGFSAFVPAIDAGSQTLSVYAHTPAKGWWFKQVSIVASTTAPLAA